jgi:uncharacterized protein YxjI
MTYVPEFEVRQKLALTINRYEVVGADGTSYGVAEQKRMALKEQVTFRHGDQVLMSFKARKVMDLGSGYDVYDGTGQQIGYFKKDFGASLLRSTFHVEGPGYAGTGQERSQAIAVVRRFMDIPFLPIHFDYVASDGAPLLSIERQSTVRDRYQVRVHDQRVDFRVAAALAVAMDALMGR